MVSMFKRRGQPKWVLSWRDGNGRRRERVAFRDKRASEQLKAKIERELAMGQAGLLDPFEKHRAAPLLDHVAAFRATLESRGRTRKYVNLVVGRLERAFAAMGVARIDELEQAKADAYLRNLRVEKRSARTRDAYAAILRGFGGWLVDNQRWPVNPFHHCKPTATEADATFERRAVSYEELVRICAAAPERSMGEYAKCHPGAKAETLAKYRRDGDRRALLYWFASYTGLRANECRQVQWRDLELDGETPCVLVRAAIAKNRKAQRIPFHSEIAAMLEQERRTRSAELGRPVRGSEPALHVPRWVVKRLRADAEYAEVDVIDEQGRVLDFHSLRASYATMLAVSGVTMQQAQRLLRHSDPRITAKVYTKLGIDDLAEGASKMPAPSGETERNNAEEGQAG